jgi:flagellar M-ring protein FliF
MADRLPQTLGTQLAGIARLPAHRQFGLVLGLAVVGALAIGAVLWAMQPRYTMLLSPAASASFVDAQAILDRSNIPHRLEDGSGALLVPANRVAEARLQLSSEGLPRGDDVWDSFVQGNSFGSSRLVENARYTLALQDDLARTITSIDGIASAKVQLALPQDSVFARDRDETKASVFLAVRPGHRLDDAEIAGIANFVAWSVPNLTPNNVSLIDESGRPLKAVAGDEGAALSSSQLDYKQRKQDEYRASIREVLAPLVGDEGMRVSVHADIDFTESESTSETYGAEPSVMVSESLREDQSSAGQVGGVPGALTNQPPADGRVAARRATGDEAKAVDENGDPITVAAGAETTPQSSSRSSLRNFQNDRTINHVRQAPASVERLSISVVVDDRRATGAEGAVSYSSRTPEELAEYNSLVRAAVGFDEMRGDTLTISNQSFLRPEPLEPLAGPPIWSQPWLPDLARYAAAAAAILLLLLLVVRPVLKNLATVPAPMLAYAESGGGSQTLLPGPGATAALPPGQRSRDASPLGRARQIAEEDPRLVANVVRQWMNTDAS